MASVADANIHLLRVGKPLGDNDRTFHYLSALTSKQDSAPASFWCDKVHAYPTAELHSRLAGSLFLASPVSNKKVNIKHIDTFQPKTTADIVNVLVAMFDNHSSRAKHTAAADIYKALILNQEGGFYIDNRPFEQTTRALPIAYNSLFKTYSLTQNDVEHTHSQSINLKALESVPVLNDSWVMFYKDPRGQEQFRGRKYPAGLAWVSPEEKNSLGQTGSQNLALRNIIARRVIISATNPHLLTADIKYKNKDYFSELNLKSDTLRNIDLKNIKSALEGFDFKKAVQLLFEDLPALPSHDADAMDLDHSGYSAYDMERPILSHWQHFKEMPVDPESAFKADRTQEQHVSAPAVKELVLQRSGKALYDIHHAEIELGIIEKGGVQHYAAKAIAQNVEEKTRQVFGQTPIDKPAFRWVDMYPSESASDDISLKI
ncbi:MAG TPA: hypothetical protein DHW71_05905 [Gammaproteobacteria bacterium]|nr:hypothetical protein [Gammaproteobacteria bacterium]HBF08512.1 hypothetical protein [Gammaproteobacteria bacterium]HCK92498.1 hypothetical protein [Gammaproteobacteria bacterium]